MSWPDCAGTRAVPDDLSAGYLPCPAYVVDAGLTFVVLGGRRVTHPARACPDVRTTARRTTAQPTPDPTSGVGLRHA